jgi:hypothetical protein
MSWFTKNTDPATGRTCWTDAAAISRALDAEKEQAGEDQPHQVQLPATTGEEVSR